MKRSPSPAVSGPPRVTFRSSPNTSDPPRVGESGADGCEPELSDETTGNGGVRRRHGGGGSSHVGNDGLQHRIAAQRVANWNLRLEPHEAGFDQRWPPVRPNEHTHQVLVGLRIVEPTELHCVSPETSCFLHYSARCVPPDRVQYVRGRERFDLRPK